MISTLAGNLCAVEADLKHALKTVEQQGRFLADQSVRIDQLEQLIKLRAVAPDQDWCPGCSHDIRECLCSVG